MFCVSRKCSNFSQCTKQANHPQISTINNRTNRSSEAYLEPSRTSTMELFSQKSSTVDVRQGTKTAPLMLQICLVNAEFLLQQCSANLTDQSL